MYFYYKNPIYFLFHVSIIFLEKWPENKKGNVLVQTYRMEKYDGYSILKMFPSFERGNMHIGTEVNNSIGRCQIFSN
jgi:hypothetical protein